MKRIQSSLGLKLCIGLAIGVLIGLLGWVWFRWQAGRLLVDDSFKSRSETVHLVVKEKPASANPMDLLTGDMGRFFYECVVYTNGRIASMYHYAKDSTRFRSAHLQLDGDFAFRIILEGNSKSVTELFCVSTNGAMIWRER